MNDILTLLANRKSMRSYEERPISESDRNLILDAALSGPTAGNQSLFTILDIENQGVKDRLSVLCDNQPFIAKSPWVLVFLADTRRWLDTYRLAGAEARSPGVADLILACEDTLIAAQNAVVAAESLGIGSCYIGDIVENREDVTDLLRLEPFVFPVTMLTFGYPTAQQLARPKPEKPPREFLVRKNAYSPLSPAELEGLYAVAHRGEDFKESVRAFCKRKYMSDFSLEMERSVSAYMAEYSGFRPGN